MPTEHALAKEESALYSARVAMWKEILREVIEADIANLTPIQALNLLNEIQIRIREVT